jgi:hypothetical protein
MGPIGHCAIAMAAKPLAPRVPLGILLVATLLLDILAIVFMRIGIEGGEKVGNPWSHGLLMSVIWSILGAFLVGIGYRSGRAGAVVGIAVFSHWILDFISHPIPFPSFSWRTWQWDNGHALPPDLPLLLANSRRVGLGLYNSISAVAATELEVGMFVVGTAIFVTHRALQRRARRRNISKAIVHE